MRIAINGCGIAGPTLAWWLRRFGHEPVIFEKAPSLRSGGYVIDFWGSGYNVAEKMGLFPTLLDDAYILERLRTVTGGGRTTSSLRVRTFQDLTNNRYLSIARSDLSRHIFEACQDVETHFATSITGLDDQETQVMAQLSNGKSETFDCVVGADGLHSHIRTLAFGPQEQFERRAGFFVAAFMLPGYRPRDELAYVSHTRPGKQISRFALRNNQTLILFVFSNELVSRQPENEAQEKAMLRSVYGDMKWEAPAILERMDEVTDIYFDRVSQFRMPAWTKGRVALVGDAAACPSLLAGEGSGLAMTEAYVLAGELKRADGDLPAAFAGYQNRLQAHLTKRQDMALRFAGFFAPKSWISLIARDLMTNLASLPVLGKMLLGPSVLSGLDLPCYEED